MAGELLHSLSGLRLCSHQWRQSALFTSAGRAEQVTEARRLQTAPHHWSSALVSQRRRRGRPPQSHFTRGNTIRAAAQGATGDGGSPTQVQSQRSDEAQDEWSKTGSSSGSGLLESERGSQDEGKQESEQGGHDSGLDLATLKALIGKDKEAGSALLHEAVLAADGDTRLVERLLQAGAHVNGIDVSVFQTGETPLHVAAHLGDLELVDFLLRRGAEVDAPDLLGRSPLCSCLVGGADLDVAKRLIKAGARVTYKSRQTGMMPLHFAVHRGSFCSYELVEFLIKRRAPLDARDYASMIPLHYAIEHDDPEEESYALFDLLLDNMGDIDIKRRDGKTVLHLAVLQCDPKRVELCLRKGARTDRRDLSQMTPLDYIKNIKKKGSLEVQMLLMRPPRRR